jgi:hypothetical protein
MRRVEMQAEEERTAAARECADGLDRTVTEQNSRIAGLFDGGVVVPEIGLMIGAGMRKPPSNNSVMRPVNGQVSAKRSPPLSLVKMTMVFCVKPFASSASSTRPTCASSAWIMRA